MKFGIFLIGLAGSFSLASQAFAADKLSVPEPEPTQYMRACDVLGEGYFYIPGTETCLKISGEVKYQIGVTNDDGDSDTQTPNSNEFESGTWNKDATAHIDVEAVSETEWGLLKSFIGLDAASEGSGDGPVVMDEGWLSIGGLRMGYADSAWSADTTDDISSGGSHSDGGLWYGDNLRQLIQYSFGGEEGFYGLVSLENDLAGDGYVPDVVGFLAYRGDWGRIWSRVGYAEAVEGFGTSLGIHVDMPNMADSSVRLIGFYADGDHIFGTGSPYGLVTDSFGNSQWSILASYQQQFTPKFGGSVGFQYFDNFYEAESKVKTGLDGYSAELSFVFTPVDNFEIRTEVQYDKLDLLDGSLSGFLWFQQSF